jgi:hypothetical protein
MPESPAPRVKRPRLSRLQFSLAGIFALMTLSAIGVAYWYQWPYAVENKQYASAADPFAAPGEPTPGANVRREVEYVRRVWGGKTVRHGPRRVFDVTGNLTISENYRNGQKDGEFITYGPQGARSRLETFRHGEKHGPSRRWNAKGDLILDESYNHDLRDGQFDVRHGDGQPAITGTFDLGHPTGKWSWFPAAAVNIDDKVLPFGARQPAAVTTSAASPGSVVGQWRDGLADGRWEWRDGNGKLYLSADFDAGHVVHSDPANLHHLLLEAVIDAAGEEPRILPLLFATASINLTKAPLKDAMDYLRPTIRVPLTIHRQVADRSFLAITCEVHDAPLLVALGQMLELHGLACDYRYGTLCIDKADAIANWKDTTGVTQLAPPRGSRLAKEWNRLIEMDFVETPVKDVLVFITDKTGGNVRFDLSRLPTPRVLSAKIPTPDSPLSVTLRGISLHNCLGVLLDQLGCKATLRGETLVIEPQ